MRTKMEDDYSYIYESPDCGITVYRRKFNETQRELISIDRTAKHDSYRIWIDICDRAETNTSLKKALDNLMLIYYTVKNDKRK